ncbi:MAG TPA: hypothetical protein VH643_32805 [Gemmataceae bacterium]|jgi:hypothetical protein
MTRQTLQLPVKTHLGIAALPIVSAAMSIFQLEARSKDDRVWSIERRDAGVHRRSSYAGDYTPEPGEALPE